MSHTREDAARAGYAVWRAHGRPKVPNALYPHATIDAPEWCALSAHQQTTWLAIADAMIDSIRSSDLSRGD